MDQQVLTGESMPVHKEVGDNTFASTGILNKGGSYLEKLCRTDTIIFDKTGTLTTGIIHVEDLVSFNGYGDSELLSYAATGEMQMTHPIEEAVVRHAQGHEIPWLFRERRRGYCQGDRGCHFAERIPHEHSKGL